MGDGCGTQIHAIKGIVSFAVQFYDAFVVHQFFGSHPSLASLRKRFSFIVLRFTVETQAVFYAPNGVSCVGRTSSVQTAAKRGIIQP